MVSLNKQIGVAVIVVLFFVFGSGVLLGKSAGLREVSVVESIINENEMNTESLLLEQQLFEQLSNNDCSFADTRIQSMSRELASLGNQLNDKQFVRSIDSATLQYLKRRYHLTQIRTYIMFKNVAEICNFKIDVILFYYTVGQQESVEQGYILDSIVDVTNVTVLAIEKNYWDKITFLERFYSIDTTPAIVVNFNSSFFGVTSPKDIELVIET